MRLMTNTIIYPYYIIIIIVTLFLIPLAQIQESLSLLHTISSSIRDRAPEVSASIRSNHGKRDSHVFDVGKYTQIYSLATKYIPNERLARGQTEKGEEEGNIPLLSIDRTLQKLICVMERLKLAVSLIPVCRRRKEFFGNETVVNFFSLSIEIGSRFPTVEPVPIEKPLTLSSFFLFPREKKNHSFREFKMFVRFLYWVLFRL